jgi:hypothetical protein
MRANLKLLGPIACFVVGAGGAPGAALAQADPYRSVPGTAYPYGSVPGAADPYRPAPGTTYPYGYVPGAAAPSYGTIPPAIPHDYPVPALRGGNGGG